MTRLLVVNPNASGAITAALAAALAPCCPPGVELGFFNPSSGPSGISDAATAEASTAACVRELLGAPGAPPAHPLDAYDGVLVCCFSEHPLVPALAAHFAATRSRQLVLGMFQAGLASALMVSPAPFGIVATGTGHKANQYVGVANFVGAAASARFIGSITTGLAVEELQEGERARVEACIKATAGALIDRGAETIVLGCAGMCGFEGWVHETAAERGKQVVIVDGAKSGLHLLTGLARVH